GRGAVGGWIADARAGHTELRMVLSTAIEELPADYRAVVVLRDVEGFSNQEIAASLGLTVVNVKIRVHRARLFLRKRLEEHFSILGEFVSGPTTESVARR